MGDVVRLPIGNRTVVEILEQALDRAREGQFAHLALCYVIKDNGAVGHCWSEGSGFGPMLGSMHYMATQFVGDLGK